jgi:hypothetical protein
MLAIARTSEQSRPLEPFHVLHDGNAGDRQLLGQHASRRRPTRQALEDHDADGVAKEGEELEHFTELASMRM